MGLLGYFVYRSLSLLLGQRFIGFLRFSLLRLTSPYFSAFRFLLLYLPFPLLFSSVDFSYCRISAFGFLLFILLQLTSPIAGSVLLDFSSLFYFS